MPLLHIGITDNQQDKFIDSELVAQNLTLIKASCTYLNLQANNIQAVAVDLPFISPIDYISSDSSRHIILPFNLGENGTAGTTMTNSIDCNFHFDVEHIPKTFRTGCFTLSSGSDGFTSATFGNSNGNLKRVDLFFHYESIHRKF
jgi:hypothetical protein